MTEVKPGQPAKAKEPKVLRLLVRATEWRPVFTNAFALIAVKDEGNDTAVRS